MYENIEKKFEGQNAVPLHLELDTSWLNEKEIQIMRKYGKMQKNISRDILVPEDITLHALHYVIQRAFGWQNSHLHDFSMTDCDFEKLTEGMFEQYGRLCGVYFRFPTGDFEDLFWDDDYTGSVSIKNWLRGKYKGPYLYGGQGDYYDANQKEVSEFYKRWAKLDLRNKSIAEAYRSMIFEGDLNCILESLCLADVLITDEETAEAGKEGAKGLPSPTPPIVKEIKYKYDYGDGWEVSIKLSECSYTEEEKNYVKQNRRPMCIAKDGENVLDDVGGISGFCDFLVTIHEGDKEEREDMRDWAKMLGWTGRNVQLKNVL